MSDDLALSTTKDIFSSGKYESLGQDQLSQRNVVPPIEKPKIELNLGKEEPQGPVITTPAPYDPSAEKRYQLLQAEKEAFLEMGEREPQSVTGIIVSSVVISRGGSYQEALRLEKAADNLEQILAIGAVAGMGWRKGTGLKKSFF